MKNKIKKNDNSDIYLKCFLIMLLISLLIIGLYFLVIRDYSCKIINKKLLCNLKNGIVFKGVKPQKNDDCDKLLYRLKQNIYYKDRQGIWKGLLIVSFSLYIVVLIIYKINKDMTNTYSMVLLITLFFFVIYKYELFNEFHINGHLKEYGDETIYQLNKKCIKNNIN